MRYLLWTLLGLSLLLPTQSVEARTLPRGGAVRKPRALKIRLPFPCGTRVQVSCGYGKKAHRRTRSRSSTNDRYALDFIRVERGNGSGKPVVAVANGIVRQAGWARGGWAPYGKRVYIEHDFKDHKGARYQSLYAHLDSIKVRPGQHVTAGTVIGTLGGSSRHRLHRFGPHLHFALYRGAGPRLGGGRAVVPEPMGYHEDIRARQVMQACARPDQMLALFPLESELDHAQGGLR